MSTVKKLFTPIAEGAETRYRNRTVDDVVDEATDVASSTFDTLKNSTVVRLFQSELLKPAVNLFSSFYGNIKDSTPSDLADQVSDYINRLDDEVAKRIRRIGQNVEVVED